MSPTGLKRIILHTDGGSRGNPGPAGYGLVLSDETGAVLAEQGGFIGRATNNEAEYAGLLAGLEAAGKVGAAELIVKSDSGLLVRQLNGAYRVRSPKLAPLFAQAQQRLRGFLSWRAEHVRREMNTRADALANDAMDRHAAAPEAAGDGPSLPQ